MQNERASNSYNNPIEYTNKTPQKEREDYSNKTQPLESTVKKSQKSPI